ncbi:HAD family phosphatase [bacterium]|nr:HAD family phosphatase [candidate division CSSED10-310 bacterium]
MFEAILFDLDGVLVESMPHHAAAWQWIMAQQGIAIDLRDAYLVEGYRSMVIARRFLGDRSAGMTDAEIEAMIERKRRYYRELTSGLRMAPEVCRTVARLREMGFRLALVTSSVRANLDHTVPDADDLFDAIITGDDVTRGKPDPQPFVTAAAHLGLPPRRCVVVENAPLGITSAVAAGAFCVALTTTLDADSLAAAHLVINGDVTALGDEDVWNHIRVVAGGAGFGA